MENGTPEATEQQDDGNAMESMVAGYNKQRGIEPEQAAETTEQAAEQSEPAQEPEQQQEQVESAAPDLAAEVQALKSQIEELGKTPASVRKIYGELGNIQRTLQQLQSQPTGGADSAEMAEALKGAEKVAEEFPELAGPLVAAIKSAMKAPRSASGPDVDVDSIVTERVAEIRHKDAIEALADDHPDYETVRETPEYAEWLKTLDDDVRERFLTTWNPAIVSKRLTEFKTWRAAAQAAQVKKQSRLEGAITPTGEGSAGPSKLPDSAGLNVGYNKVRRLGGAR